MASVGSSHPNASTGGEWKRQLEESDRRFNRNLNEIRIERGMPPVNSLFDPIGNAINDRTIFVKIWDEIYPISREILHTVFSDFGILVGIERLSRGFHSTIRFFDKNSTIRAFESLNGRNVYDGCCKLELFLVTAMESSCSNQESVAFEENANLEEIEEIEGAYPSQELIDKPKVCNDVLELEQAGQRTPTIHQEIPTEVSQAINTNDLSSEIVGASDIDEGKLQNRQTGTDISSTKFVNDGRAITFIKGQPTTCDEAHLAKKLGAMSNNNMPFEIEGMGDPTIAWGINIDSKHPKIFKEFKAEFDVGASTQELVRDLKVHPKVIRSPLVVVESEKLVILPEILPDSVKIKVARYVVSSRDLLETMTAYQLFVELLVKGTFAAIGCVDVSHSLTKTSTAYKVFEEMSRSVGTTIFDPSGSLHLWAVKIGKGRVIDMASTDQFGNNLVMGALLSLHVFKDHLKSMPFDRGRHITTLWVNPETIYVVQAEKPRHAVTLTFDPGGFWLLIVVLLCNVIWERK